MKSAKEFLSTQRYCVLGDDSEYSKEIQSYLERYAKQYIESFDAIDAMKNDRIKDLQQSNKELVELLDYVYNFSKGMHFHKASITDQEITELITKHKQS